MIILDTNVISEMMRAAPSPGVETWLASQNAGQIYLTAVTVAELRTGLAILPQGRRRDDLARAVDSTLGQDFQGRILSFDSTAANAYATIAAARREAGRPISVFDCQIVAIAQSRNAALATRDVHDFDGCGVTVINPWNDA